MYDYYNANPLGLYEDDCVIRSISCATGRSWDSVYDELSDLMRLNTSMIASMNLMKVADDMYNKAINITE